MNSKTGSHDERNFLTNSLEESCKIPVSIGHSFIIHEVRWGSHLFLSCHLFPLKLHLSAQTPPSLFRRRLTLSPLRLPLLVHLPRHPSISLVRCVLLPNRVINAAGGNELRVTPASTTQLAARDKQRGSACMPLLCTDVFVHCSLLY